MAHIVHEHYVWNVHNQWKCIRALINCGATSVFMGPRLLQQIELLSELAHITIVCIYTQTMMSVKDSWKMTIWCQNLNTLKLVKQHHGFFVSMAAYIQILGHLSFLSMNSELDWSKSYMIGLQLRIRNPRTEHTITEPPQGDCGVESSVFQ